MAYLVEMSLVNPPFGDPGLYIDFHFGRRAMLFDLGELTPLPTRKLLRVSHVFVSHAHLDHFNGFDRLLRLSLYRRARIDIVGPPGFIDRVANKLGAYSWNLIAEGEPDAIFAVAEFHGDRLGEAAEFHSRDAFRRRHAVPPSLPKGVILDEAEFQIRAATLDHGIPSLAFAFIEKIRINVWKDRLDRMGIEVGPWLKAAKAAARRGEPDDTLVDVLPAERGATSIKIALGELRANAFRTAPGGSFAYVVDAAYHDSNAARITALARDAHTLFIEAVFLDEDREIAAKRKHLTAAQAGALARAAHVDRVVPFHFSPRYADREDRLRREVNDAFKGAIDVHGVG